MGWIQGEGVHPEGWDLVRHHIAEYAFKVGENPGLVAFLEVDSEADAMAMIDMLPLMASGLASYQLDPVSSVAAF